MKPELKELKNSIARLPLDPSILQATLTEAITDKTVDDDCDTTHFFHKHEKKAAHQAVLNQLRDWLSEQDIGGDSSIENVWETIRSVMPEGVGESYRQYLDEQAQKSAAPERQSAEKLAAMPQRDRIIEQARQSVIADLRTKPIQSRRTKPADPTFSNDRRSPSEKYYQRPPWWYRILNNLLNPAPESRPPQNVKTNSTKRQEAVTQHDAADPTPTQAVATAPKLPPQSNRTRSWWQPIVKFFEAIWRQFTRLFSRKASMPNTLPTPTEVGDTVGRQSLKSEVFRPSITQVTIQPDSTPASTPQAADESSAPSPNPYK